MSAKVIPLHGEPLAYTLEDMAALWGLHLSTVKRLVRSGALGSVKLGAARRIPAEAVHEFMGDAAGADVRAVTIEEAGEMLAVSRRQVYRLVDAGELRTFHVGRARRVSVASILELLHPTAEAQ